LETPSAIYSTFERNNAGHLDTQSRCETSVTKVGAFRWTDVSES